MSHSALALSIQVNGKPIGSAGQLWPADARALDATAPVVFAEIDLRALTSAEGSSAARRYTEIPRFPSVTRDIAMLAPLNLAHAQIEAALRRANEPLLASVELFDVFSDPTGAKIPADQRSLAYSLTYRSPERTLTADEVNSAHAKLKQRLTAECGVALRE
jgi:phenylalanyl-tRNA synthetase beta chain